jgi:hypothetical protein
MSPNYSRQSTRKYPCAVDEAAMPRRVEVLDIRVENHHHGFGPGPCALPRYRVAWAAQPVRCRRIIPDNQHANITVTVRPPKPHDTEEHRQWWEYGSPATSRGAGNESSSGIGTCRSGCHKSIPRRYPHRLTLNLLDTRNLIDSSHPTMELYLNPPWHPRQSHIVPPDHL